MWAIDVLLELCHQYEIRINHNVAVVASVSSLFNVSYRHDSKHKIRLCFNKFFYKCIEKTIKNTNYKEYKNINDGSRIALSVLNTHKSQRVQRY